MCDKYMHSSCVMGVYIIIVIIQQQNSLEVTMFHYTDWPANGVAKDTNSLLSMIKQVVEIQRSRPNRPVTVMCR